MSTSVFRAVPRAMTTVDFAIPETVSNALKTEALTVPLESIPNGSGEARGTGTVEGWISGLSMARLSNVDLQSYPLLNAATRMLGDFLKKDRRAVMLNKLEPGSGLKKHRDGKPDMLRFHMPLITNDKVVWWDEWTGEQHMQEMVWFGPVNYCGWLHSMSNLGLEARYHLIADFK